MAVFPPTGSPLAMRLVGAAGALLCGVAVGLGAYASHGVEGAAAVRLGLAALFGFGHGLALVVLAPRAVGRWTIAPPLLLLAGVLLFSGSLAAAALAGASTRLAPVGGSLLMLGWLAQAVASLRRR